MRVISGITRWLSSDSFPIEGPSEAWLTELASLPLSQTGSIGRLINENRLSLPVQKALAQSQSEVAVRLGKELEPAVREAERTRHERDKVLRRLVQTFRTSGIDYTIFKTLNRTDWIGVDVDALIKASDYQDGVKALLSSGFYSIDDLSKTYATGFMLRNNSIVLDLHTKLTILGVPYFSSESMLKNSREIEFHPRDAPEPFRLNILNDVADSVVRMAHSVIKEGSVSAGEIAEVTPALSDLASVQNLITAENLQVAAAVFSCTAHKVTQIGEYGRLGQFDQSLLPSLVKASLDEALRDLELPCKLPTDVSILSLLDHLQRVGELSVSVPTMMRNLAFKRNAAHLGHTLFERLGIG